GVPSITFGRVARGARSEDLPDWHVASVVPDPCPPATGRQLRDGHAALLSRVRAHASARLARNLRDRRPHVSEGMPSATRRSTVLTDTPISSASSDRVRYRSPCGAEGSAARLTVRAPCLAARGRHARPGRDPPARYRR